MGSPVDSKTLSWLPPTLTRKGILQSRDKNHPNNPRYNGSPTLITRIFSFLINLLKLKANPIWPIKKFNGNIHFKKANLPIFPSINVCAGLSECHSGRPYLFAHSVEV